LQAHGLANLFRSIGDAVQSILLRDAGTKSVLIAVTAGDANRVTGRLHARSDDPAFIDGFAQSHVGEISLRADVADAGEAGQQSVARMQHAENCPERVIVAHDGRVAFGIAQDATHQVRVGIDESRQQSHVAEIDRLSVGGNTDR
jgi:hypothetical protein